MDSLNTSREIEVVLKTVNNIFIEWQLTEVEQQCILTDTATLVRLSRILNIYRLLKTMWDPQRSAKWLRSPNEYFEGKCALDIISEADSGLEAVQKYLKHELQDEENPAP